MAVDKKVVARKAAAKYSTNLTLATIEYARLQDEMLSLLPSYRHPANDEFTEHMIFFDPDCINGSGSAYQVPKFIMILEKEGIADDILTAIKEYVRESELRTIELAQCKDELSELKAKISDAQRIYNEYRNERSEKRNALVVQAIGLSTGLAPKRINKKRAYVDYVNLVRKKDMSRN